MVTFNATDEPTIYRFRDKNANRFIGGIMVSVFASKVVDSGLFGGVVVSVLVPKAVDRGFIAGVMVIVLVSKAVSRQER
jgi:hypothetical protein